MQGGTNEPILVEQTAHHQYEDGSWYSTKSAPRRMPKAVCTQELIREHSAQTFAEKRPRPQEVDA